MHVKLEHDDLVAHTIVSKLSLTKTGGSWVGEELTSVIYLPVDAPETYKIYRKAREDALQRRSMWEMLFHFSGGVDTQQYLQGIKETETALASLEKTYNFPSKSLLFVDFELPDPVQIKLFTDAVILEHWLKRNTGLTIMDVETGNIPQRHNGTRIFDQEWHSSKDVVNTTSFSPSEAVNQNNSPTGMI